MRRASCSIRMPDSATPWWPGSRSSSSAPRWRSSAWSGAAWPCGARASRARPPGCAPPWPRPACSICPSSGTDGRGVDLLGPKDVVLDPTDRASPGGDHPLRQGRRRGLPDRLGHPGHGERAHRQDDRRRGRPGGALGEFHQGLLHRSGAGRPARFAGQQRAPPPRRRRGRPDDADGDRSGVRHDAARRPARAGPRPPAPPACRHRRRPTCPTRPMCLRWSPTRWSAP